MIPKINPTETNAWKKLEAYYNEFNGKHIKELFENDADRFQKYSLKFEDFWLIFQKTGLMTLFVTF
jgi:glucose-6-phosphate isomerase